MRHPGASQRVKGSPPASHCGNRSHPVASGQMSIVRPVVVAVLLLLPVVLAHLGVGTKKAWGMYALGAPIFFFIFAIAGWISSFAMTLTVETETLRPLGSFAGSSFAFGCCAFFGGAFAEKRAGNRQRA